MEKVKLKEILEVRRGTSLSGKYYSKDGELIRLTLGNFNYPGYGFKENTSKEDTYFNGEVKQQYILKKGDIITPLTEQVSGLLGETATIPENNKYIQSGDIGLVIPKEEKLDKRFAYYLISSSMIKKQLDVSSQQTKIRHTSPDKIKDCIAWIPEKSRQVKIAKILDEINDAIDKNSQINNNLEELIKTIYQRWFIEFEFPNEEGKPYKSSGDKFVYNDELKQEIPEGWNVKKITEIANVYQPEIITIKDIDLNGDYLLYGAGGLMGKYNKFNHEKSAIAISCRGNCGDTFMTQPKSWINGNVMVVAPIEKYNYKEYIFRSLFKEKIMPLITGSVQKQITRTNLSNLKLLIPNKRTLELFEDTVKPYRSKINLVINENQRLTELKNFLLPLLMNGQINVDDIEI